MMEDRDSEGGKQGEGRREVMQEREREGVHVAGMGEECGVADTRYLLQHIDDIL